MEEIKFTIYGNAKALKRHRDRKPVQKNGKWFTPKYDPSKNDKDNFLVQALQYRQDNMPFDIPFELQVVCYFQRPNNHYGTGKNKNILKPNMPVFHKSKPDSDNIFKFIADALNGIFWKDDSNICIAKITKLYSNDFTPRTEILIKEADFNESSNERNGISIIE
jgi:Holliday junction resolvase RusA-like endonuclease